MQRGGFSISSKHCVLSVNWMCENFISSCLYCATQSERKNVYFIILFITSCRRRPIFHTYNFLFQREYIVIEKFMQFLVGVVDAQLLERIDSEILETEYIEHAEETSCIVARIDARVDVTNEPCKRSRIKRFCHLFIASVQMKERKKRKNGNIKNTNNVIFDSSIFHLPHFDFLAPLAISMESL